MIATGTNWRAGNHIQVTWEDNRRLAVDTIVNDRGEFSVVFTIPTDAPRGARTIYFTALESRYFVTASFTVSDEKPIPLPEIDYFALGESIVAGHGLKDDRKPCRQSDKAYPYQVRNYLQLRFRVNFPPEHHLACSGATVWEPSPEVLKQHRYKWFKNQVIEVLDHLNKNKQQGIERPTLVSITIGANDFDFAPTSQAGFAFLWRALAGQDNEFQDWVYERRNRTEKALLEMEELDTLVGQPNVTVVFTRYHHPLTNKSWVYIGMEKAHDAIIGPLKLPLPFESCGHFFNVLTCQDRGYTVLDELNAVQNSVVGDMFKNGEPIGSGLLP